MAAPETPSAVQVVMLDQAPEPRPQIAKNMAYGPSQISGVAEAGVTFRQQRGQPYYRMGRVVPVAPQFKGQKIAVQNTNSLVAPGVTTGNNLSSVVATIPTGVKVVGGVSVTRQNSSV